MFTLEDLGKIKMTVERPNLQSDNTETNEDIDYGFANKEKLVIHLNDTEGTKPLFDERCVNRERTPSLEKQRGRSKADSTLSFHSPDYRRYREKPTDIKRIIKKLEDMLENIEKKRHDRSPSGRRIKSSNKRSRSDIKRYSRSPSFLDRSRSTHNSRSPTPKRFRKEYDCKKTYADENYGLSSNFNDTKTEVRNKKDAYRYRESSNTSRSSPTSDRSYSRYLSKKIEKEMPNFMIDSFLSTDSSSSYENARYRRKSRKPRDDRLKYSRKSSRRYADKYEQYDGDYYGQAMSYHDMKERYARFRTLRSSSGTGKKQKYNINFSRN